jgi:hypothetical protein
MPPKVDIVQLYVDLLFNNNRESERERRALAGLRLHPDFAAVHFDDPLRYGEPQTSAALPVVEKSRVYQGRLNRSCVKAGV